MKPSMYVRRLAGALALIFVTAGPPTARAAEEEISADAVERMSYVLAGRRVPAVEEPAGGVRVRGASSLRDLYRNVVRAVPIVVSRDGTGSSVVIRVDPAESMGLIVTNHHVVEKPFHNNAGVPFALILFHDAQIAGEPFDPVNFAACIKSRSNTPWCEALRRSLRTGVVLGTDPARDLALLAVRDIPKGIKPIPNASLDAVEAGDDVAVIGHPKGFLWTLTRGIVSAVRARYPMGESQGTIIQTQAPIAPGNSGGPLLTFDGRLAGVITWQLGGTQGLNAAVAINEVQKFAAEQAARSRPR